MNKAKQLLAASNLLHQKARDIESEALDMQYKAAEILAQKHGVETIDIGGWKCENSEIGICYYNPDDDPCLDNCLVCGHPDERK